MFKFLSFAVYASQVSASDMEQDIEASERQNDFGTFIETFIVSYIISIIGTLFFFTTVLLLGSQTTQNTGNQWYEKMSHIDD